MERGYSRQEAYHLLREHGVKLRVGKRRRIAIDVLQKIERGDMPA